MDVGANIPGQRPTDVRWAVANTLQFFAATERCPWLGKYNALAERFAPGGVWKGAYGAIAVPQLLTCERMLGADIHTRRAYVDMGPVAECDANRPPCWNHLQFLVQGDTLYVHCYQRSLNLWGVMPYDCVVLTNVLNWMKWKLGLGTAVLQWTVGSLHIKEADLAKPREWSAASSCLLPADVLNDPLECERWLAEPADALQPYREILLGGLHT